MASPPPGCSEDLGRCQVDRVHRVGWFALAAHRVNAWVEASTVLSLIKLLLGSSAMAIGGFAWFWMWVGLVDNTFRRLGLDLNGVATFTVFALTLGIPFLSLLVLSALRRPGAKPLQADARYLLFGEQQWPRERVTLQQDGTWLTITCDDAHTVVRSDAASLDWFVQQFDERGVAPVGDASEVPAGLRAVVQRQPDA